MKTSPSPYDMLATIAFFLALSEVALLAQSLAEALADEGRMVEVSANGFKNKHEQGSGLCIPSGEALGAHPVVELSRTIYEKGITVAKDAMHAVESRLQRNPLLPKWDILIRPA